MTPEPVDLGDLDLSGLSREDILSALIDAAIIGAPDEAEFSTPEISPDELAPPEIPGAGELPAHENPHAPVLSKSTVSDAPFYDPQEARDETGKWTAGGGAAPDAGADRRRERAERARQSEAKYQARAEAIRQKIKPEWRAAVHTALEELRATYDKPALGTDILQKLAKKGIPGDWRGWQLLDRMVFTGELTEHTRMVPNPTGTAYPFVKKEVRYSLPVHLDPDRQRARSEAGFAWLDAEGDDASGLWEEYLCAPADAPFYSPDQLRDGRGRWTAGGASGGMTREEHAARREAASAAIRDYLGATHQPTREETARLAGHLATLTVKQLHDLRKEHGLKDPRLLKEDFVNALHGYFAAHREKQAVLARGREDEARRAAEKQAQALTPEIEAQHRAPYKGAFLDNSHPQEVAGFPKATETLRSWPMEELVAERNQLLRGSFGGMFGQNAKKMLAVVEKVIGERSALEVAHQTPEPHQALAAAVAGKQGFTRPFRRGPYVAVRHDPTGLHVEAEAGNHSGRFAVKDPSNVVHSRHDTAEAAVAAVQSANRLGTGDSTVDRELRDRAAQAGKGLPEPNEDAKAGRIPAPSALRAAGTRPSDVAKSYGLPHDFYDDQRKLYDRNSGFPTMRGEVHVNDKYDPQGKVAAAQDARDRAAKRGDLTGATRKYHEEQIRKALAEAVARASRAARFSEEGGTIEIDSPPGEGDVADLIPASVPFSADPGGQDEGRFVLKDAPVVFRAGPYDFPPEKGGPFEMTPEDIREALEDFPEDGVPITNEHNSRCIFQGKLGRFLMPRPSPDYATFGGKVKLARPVLDLLGTGPIKLSANWDRATKRLKDVSLVAHPRITDAALFAAFAKDADEGGTEKYITPHGRAGMQAMHDLAARSGALCKSPAGVPPGASERSAAARPREAGMAAFTSEHERDAMQAIHDTAAGMGAACLTTKLPKRAAALEAMMSEYVPTPAPSAREAELERQLTESREREAKFNERLAAVEKANREAQFSAAVSRLEAEAVAFVNANGKRLYGKRDREAVASMYVAAGRASIGTTAEVQFSDEKGAVTKGSLLDAFKASILARPEHKLDTEQVPGPLTVLFGAESKDPEDAETERLRKAMEERAAAQNARNGGRR